MIYKFKSKATGDLIMTQPASHPTMAIGRLSDASADTPAFAATGAQPGGEGRGVKIGRAHV